MPFEPFRMCVKNKVGQLMLSLVSVEQQSFVGPERSLMGMCVGWQAVFASWIPEITELAANRSKYGGKYSKDVRRRYKTKTATYFVLTTWNEATLQTYIVYSDFVALGLCFALYCNNNRQKYYPNPSHRQSLGYLRNIE